MKSKYSPFFAALSVLPLFACHAASKPVTMADSFDLDLFGPHVDDLHSPYVAGARIGITVSVSNGAGQSEWTLESSNPAVVSVASPLSAGSATILAAGPGQTTLMVRDATGAVVDSHTVSVAVPDQVSLYAEGLLLTGAGDSAAEITHASIVTGGEATFLVRYFLDGTELYGSGALTPTATANLTASTVSETFAQARDFLQVATLPSAGATESVSLAIANHVVAQVPVAVVAPQAVTKVSIDPQSTSGAQDGDQLTLYAHAVDATDAEVYGAGFTWSASGVSGGSFAEDGGFVPVVPAGAGPADLFFYTYASSQSETVTAAYDGFAPSAIVHAHGGSVGSTANVACAVANAAAGAGAGPWGAGVAMAMTGVGLARRRRSRRRVAK